MNKANNENGPGAAATARGAWNVALGKPTGWDNPNPEGQQSPLVADALGCLPPDNTGRKQAARPSLRTAIDAMCRSCIYDPGNGNGTWREQVQQCSSGNCPLHPVRPISVKAQKRDAEARQAAVAVSGPPNPETTLHAPRLERNGPIAEQRRAA